MCLQYFKTIVYTFFFIVLIFSTFFILCCLTIHSVLLKLAVTVFTGLVCFQTLRPNWLSFFGHSKKVVCDQSKKLSDQIQVQQPVVHSLRECMAIMISRENPTRARRCCHRWPEQCCHSVLKITLRIRREKKKKKQTSNMFKKSLNQNWNVHYRYMRIKIKVICIGIPYFHDWKPGRFRTTALIRQMWFISYLEYVAIFAQYCSSFTWIDLNSKSFTFTPTSGTSIELNEQIYPLFQGRQNSGRSWGENKRLEGN